MLKIGLTGGIGTGKSIVSSIMKEQGVKVIDADKISREVLEKYPIINEKIKETFGERFFSYNKLNRRELGNFIFKHEKRRKKLENIIMPYINKEIDLKFKSYENEGQKLCVLDAPTLIEQGIYKNMYKNILVWVDKNTQIRRVKIRDNLSEKEILDRINAQMDLEHKKNYVDFIIDNSKDILTTKEQVSKIVKLLKKDEG